MFPFDDVIMFSSLYQKVIYIDIGIWLNVIKKISEFIQSIIEATLLYLNPVNV